MPLVIPYPLINGNRFEWSSCEVDVAGFKYQGIKSMSYSHGLEPGELRGNRSYLIGRTRGKYSTDASMEMYKLEYDDLIARLAIIGAASLQGFMEVSFLITAAYQEIAAGAVSTDVLGGARIKKADLSAQEGSDPITMKVDLHLMWITHNGLSPLGVLAR